MFFQNWFVNDLTQGKLCRYRLLTDDSPERAARGPAESWAQQLHDRAHSGPHADEHKAIKECNKTASSLVKHFVDFLLKSSLSSPSPSLIIFSPCPPHITWHFSFTWRMTALQYCVDSCHPTARISRGYPPSWNAPQLPTPRGQQRALGWAACACATASHWFSTYTQECIHVSATLPTLPTPSCPCCVQSLFSTSVSLFLPWGTIYNS